MEITEKNEFVEVGYDTKNSVLFVEWSEATAEMTENQYKETLLKLADYLEKYQIKYWLGETRKFAYAIVPELQEWTATDFNKRLGEVGLKKMALIIPAEFIANLAVQQTVEEMQEQSLMFETRYFDNLEDAQKWLSEEE